MGLTPYALEQMGYRRRRDNESLQAAFSSLHAFEVDGILPSSELLIGLNGSVGGVDYRLALAETLNAAAQIVVSEDFVDGEPEWVAERNCSPPYLLIHIGPTTTHEMTGNFLREETFRIHTYEAFIPASEELREMEAKVIPSVLSALSCIFGTLPKAVRFRELKRAVMGKTTDGKSVFDFGFGFDFRFKTLAKHSVPLSDIQDRIKRAADLASRMSPKVSHFYHLALKEDDPLKRFLYLFLTIERQTHAVFKSTDHGVHMAGLLQVPARVQSTGTAFLGTQHERWKSLQDRFVWCALTVWTHLNDEDINNFANVKKVRDRIAHGEIAAPSAEAVALAERVAAKLQLAPHGEDA